MELNKKEIEWVKKMVAQEEEMEIAMLKNDKAEKAREKVAKKYEKQLKKLADEGKITERKALIEEMSKEADEAEKNIAN